MTDWSIKLEGSGPEDAGKFMFDLVNAMKASGHSFYQARVWIAGKGEQNFLDSDVLAENKPLEVVIEPGPTLTTPPIEAKPQPGLKADADPK